MKDGWEKDRAVKCVFGRQIPLRIELSGSFRSRDTEQLESLRERIADALKGGNLNIIFDLERCEYLSSAGLRLLAEARNKVEKRTKGNLRQGRVVLADIPSHIGGALDLAGFSDQYYFINSSR